MSLRDEFREKMIEIAGNDCYVDDAIHCPPKQGDVPACYECKVDRILSLQDSGHRLAIVKEGAELPDDDLRDVMLLHGLVELLYAFRKNGGDVDYCVKQILEDFAKANYVQEVPNE